MPPKRVYTFDKYPHVLSRADIDGYCIDRDEGPPCEMWVSPKLHHRRELDTLIHEATHAEFTKADHAKVTAFGENLAQLLWDQGYRRKVKK